MTFLVQFVNKQALVNLFKDHKLHKPYGLAQFCWSLGKNLLVLVYSKLHSKPYVYLHK